MTTFKGPMIAAVLLLGGACDEVQGPHDLNLGLATLTNSPVYVLDYTAAGLSYPLLPALPPGDADRYPRVSEKVLVTRSASDEDIEVNVAWLEVLTQRAYAVRTTVREEDLDRRNVGLELSVLLLPGGEFKVISDPLPVIGAKEQIIRDIVQGCARRRPDLDRDIRGEIDAIPMLRERISFAKVPIDAPPCGGQE